MQPIIILIIIPIFKISKKISLLYQLIKKAITFYSITLPKEVKHKKEKIDHTYTHPSITSLDLDQRNRSKEQAPFQNNTLRHLETLQNP